MTETMKTKPAAIVRPITIILILPLMDAEAGAEVVGTAVVGTAVVGTTVVGAEFVGSEVGSRVGSVVGAEVGGHILPGEFSNMKSVSFPSVFHMRQ